MSNKRKYQIGIGLIIALLSVIGISYAYWMFTIHQTDENLVTSKCFEVTMLKAGKGITLENAYPVTDEEGKSQDGYTFTIKNTCNTLAYYQVNLEELVLDGQTKRLDSKYIKVSLNDSKGKILSEYTKVEPTLKEEDTDVEEKIISDKSHKLTSDSLDPGEEKEYTLKLWMADSTPAIDEVMNATFESKVSVIASYIEEEDAKNRILVEISEPTDYSKEKEIVTFTVTSDKENINITEYSLDGTIYNSLDKPSNNVTVSLDFTEETEYTIYFKDSLGNIEPQTFTPTKLDQTGPTINVTETSDENGAVVNITFEDLKSGLKEYRIEDGINSIDLEEEWTKFTEEKTQIVTIHSEENKKIIIKAKDKLDNVKEQEFTITKADTKGPELTIDNPKNDEWTNESVIIHLNATDDISGVNKFYYSTDEEETKTWNEIDEVTLNGKNGTATLNISKEGEQTIYIKAEDKLGNESDIKETKVKIDTSEPSISSFTTQDTWGETNTLTAKVEDPISGIAGYYFGVSNSIPTVQWVLENNYPTELTTYSATANSNTTWYFYVKDQAGNISSQEVTVNKVDNGLPSQEFSISLDTPDGDNGWYKTQPTITITAIDDQSGVEKVESCTTTDANCTNYSTLELDGSSGSLSRKGTITLPDGENSKVCVKVTDVVGKVSSDCSPGYNVDATPPTIESVTGKLNRVGITFTANVTENGSGIKSKAGYSFTIKDGNNTIGTFISDTAIYTYTDVTEGHSYTVTVIVTDNVGNTSIEVTSKSVKVLKKVSLAGMAVPLVEDGEGLYEVNHKDDVSTLGAEWKSKPEYRYAGASPDNYVWFNCDEGQMSGEAHCEKWRIIGLVNVKTESGNVEQRLKIIRADSIGEYYWDHKADEVGSSKSAYGSNDWTDSQLMAMLNDNYYNSNNNSCYQGSSVKVTCDFTATSKIKGLSMSARGMIDNKIVWNIGGWDDNIVKTSEIYGYERGENVDEGREATWSFSNTKKPATSKVSSELSSELFNSVGLMYPSDYGYAIGGESRNFIDNKTIAGYDDNKDDDWLYIGYEWLLTPYLGTRNSAHVFFILSTGTVSSYFAYFRHAVRPVVYLSSKVIISDGEGSSSSPFTLSVQ